MPSQKRKSAALSQDFADSSDEDTSNQRTKPSDLSSNKRTKPTTSSSLLDDEGNQYWLLSQSRRIVLSKFKGTTLVSIREYYQKDGKDLPGKKGISLTLDQYRGLLGVVPEIGDALKEMGEEVGRVVYDRVENGEGEGEEGVKHERSGNGVANGGIEEKVKKSNHEATSDEDDGD